MFASKNAKLVLVAGVMLFLAITLLAAGLAYRAGYSKALADLASLTPTPTQLVAAIIPTPTPAPAADPGTSTNPPPADTPTPIPPTPLPPTAAPVSNAGVSQSAAPTATPEPTLPPPTESLGEVQATIAQPTYINEGRWAEVMVTVHNISVPTGISTGYTYVTPNPGGGTQYVTIFGVIHDEVPLADIDADAPMWIGWVRFSDGKQYYFPAGCLYVETIDAKGWEPIGPAEGFKWEVHWTGGFYDCGNSTHKIPPQPKLMPGQSATIPLYVYIQHPRLWEDKNWSSPKRVIEYIGLEVRDGLGQSLGIVAEYFYP